MPKIRRSPQLVTRLAPADLRVVREIVYTRKISYSSFIREAILWYLKSQQQQQLNEIEGVYASQLRAIMEPLTDAITRGLVDIHSVYQFLGHVEKPLMHECTTIARKRIFRPTESDFLPDAIAVQAS